MLVGKRSKSLLLRTKKLQIVTFCIKKVTIYWYPLPPTTENARKPGLYIGLGFTKPEL